MSPDRYQVSKSENTTIVPLPLHPDAVRFRKEAEELALASGFIFVGKWHDFYILTIEAELVRTVLRHNEIEAAGVKLQTGVERYYSNALRGGDSILRVRTERETVFLNAEASSRRARFDHVPAFEVYTSIFCNTQIPDVILEGFSDMNGVDLRPRQDGKIVVGRPLASNRFRELFGLPPLLL